MQIKLASIDGLPKIYSSKAKYLNFLEISIIAFNVCNLNQIRTQSIVFLKGITYLWIFCSMNQLKTSYGSLYLKFNKLSENNLIDF